MKTANELRQNLIDGEEGALDEVRATVQEALAASGGLAPVDAIAVTDRILDASVRQLGGLLVQVGVEAGVMPNGVEVEMVNMMDALSAVRSLALLEYIEAKQAKESQIEVPAKGLFVPGGPR